MIYMASYLLDTNHISPMVTPEHRLRSLIIQRHDAGDTFYIAVPALTEMLFGIRVLPRAERICVIGNGLRASLVFMTSQNKTPNTLPFCNQHYENRGDNWG